MKDFADLISNLENDLMLWSEDSAVQKTDKCYSLFDAYRWIYGAFPRATWSYAPLVSITKEVVI